MGYLRDDEDEENDDNLDEFKFYINNVKFSYDVGNFDNAFFFLKQAFEIYETLSSTQKSFYSENPLHRREMAMVCVFIYNLHDGNEETIVQIINRHRIPVNVCDNCGDIFSVEADHCYKCGKPIEKEYDEFREKLANDLQKIVYDKAAIPALVSRTMILIESNDCVLKKIEEIDLMNIHFYFEKEHRYFTTT